MFGSLVSSLSKTGVFKTKLILYIIIGIIVLVVISVLLDGIKKYIRGLDTAALGALLIWLGSISNKYALVKTLSDLLYLVGGTLVVVGLLVFVVIKVRRGKRRARKKQAMKQAAGKELQEEKEREPEEKDAEA